MACEEWGLEAGIEMDMLGNEANQEMLFRAVEADRLHHALLFHGPEGVGKRRMAFRLAMYRTCPQRLEGAGDCGGGCPSCSRMREHYRRIVQPGLEEAYEKQQHPDLFYLEPYDKDTGWILFGDREKKGKKKKGGGKNVDEWYGSVRWLQEHLRFKPHETIGLTVIIDRPDRIYHEARNALLKTLEEPPPGCLFILVTSKPDALMSTYRSRCQPVRFRRFDRTMLEEILRERFDRPPDEARLLAGVSGGSLGRALEIDIDSWREKRALALEMVETAARPGWAARQSLMEMADAISRSKNQWELVGRDIPEILGSLMRDLLRLRSGSLESELTSADLAEELRVLAGRLDSVDPGMVYRLAEDVKRGLERNLNRRLVCETMLINLKGMFDTEIL